VSLIDIIWPIYKKQLLKRAQIVGNQLMPFIKEGDRVLDFGCSIMFTTKYVSSRKKILLTGIDVINYKNLSDGDIKFVKYDGGKLPFKEDQFDVVVTLFVLHHTNNPEFYLKELIRVSKKTILICEDTYINKFEGSVTKLICWFANFTAGDKNLKRNFKSIEEWKELFTKCNVKLIAMKRFYPYLIKKIPTRNILFTLRKNS